jgi:hypothetical protein
MLFSLFIHKIQVLRFAQSGQDNLGQITVSSSAFPSLPYIPARIESWDAKEEYRDSQGRIVNRTLIYTPIGYPILQVEDDVYDKTNGQNVWIGRVVGVNPALKAFTTTLDHYEIIIEKP